MNKLSTRYHNRSHESAGYSYIYLVNSRRLQGLSIGINLNQNNACNWQCIYCDVPHLTRGAAAPIDLALLKTELEQFLEKILRGHVDQQFNQPVNKRIQAITIAGNGEPTSVSIFDQVIASVIAICKQKKLLPTIKLVLISNGSLMYKPAVQRGIANWGLNHGEVWFKVDSATTAGIRNINQVYLHPGKVLKNLKICSQLCPTWIQTCVFAYDGFAPTAQEQQAYLDFLQNLPNLDIHIRGVLLYGATRPSLQLEAERITPLPNSWLNNLAASISTLGFDVKIFE